jgi:hypothetical protein
VNQEREEQRRVYSVEEVGHGLSWNGQRMSTRRRVATIQPKVSPGEILCKVNVPSVNRLAVQHMTAGLPTPLFNLAGGKS